MPGSTVNVNTFPFRKVPEDGSGCSAQLIEYANIMPGSKFTVKFYSIRKRPMARDDRAVLSGATFLVCQDHAWFGFRRQ